MLDPPLLIKFAVAPYEEVQVVSSMLVMHLSRLFTLVGTLVDAVIVHDASAGVVRQVSRSVHFVASHFAATVAGRLEVAPFALLVQVALVGVCIQAFRDVTSVCSNVQVAVSHFAANFVGIVVVPPYVPVQVVVVGSCMQFFNVVISVLIVVQVEESHLAASVVGSVADPPYVPVHAVATGSVMQLFRVVTSVVIVLHLVVSHFAAKVVGIDPALP